MRPISPENGLLAGDANLYTPGFANLSAEPPWMNVRINVLCPNVSVRIVQQFYFKDCLDS